MVFSVVDNFTQTNLQKEDPFLIYDPLYFSLVILNHKYLCHKIQNRNTVESSTLLLRNNRYIFEDFLFKRQKFLPLGYHCKGS